MDIEDACKALRKAMRGIGTDEKRIINILSETTNSQRQEIKIEFMTMYGKSLEEELSSETGGAFLKCLKKLLQPIWELEAEYVRKAMKGIGTNEQILIDHLCTKDASDIQQLKQVFTKIYNKSLDEEVASEESGEFGRILRSVCTGNRSSNPADDDLAIKEAAELYEAGQGTIGTDETEFIRIFCQRSFPQLKATFEAYENEYSNSIVKAIKKETSRNMEKALLAIAISAQNKPKYFAERIHSAMKGAGTEDDDLIRLIITRSDIDIKEIASEYFNQYERTLVHDVKKETSGDYEKLLVALIEK